MKIDWMMIDLKKNEYFGKVNVGNDFIMYL